MQDYPQHLFISYLLSTFDSPSFDWKKHYIIDLKADPYNLFYYLTRFFNLFCDIETSGKIFLSIYIIIVAVLVIKASRSMGDHPSPPWGLLLLFPFSFSQIYFLGFTNYLISVPLLFLALLDLERLVSSRLSIRSLLQHFLFQLSLFISHPYSVLLYLAFAFAGSLFYLSESGKFKRALSMPLVLAMLFLFWYARAYHPEVLDLTEEWGLRWSSAGETLGFYLLMFTGMKWTIPIDWPTAFIWLAIMGAFTISGAVHRRNIVIPWKMVSLWVLSLLGFALLPFWLTYYSYFNLRIAPVSYFFIAMILGRIKLSSRAAFLVVALATLLMVLSSDVQGKLSQETAEIMPLLAGMERNATILPLMVDSSAKELDPYFFEFHKHEPNYYHIFVGGGATPALFSSPLLPVQYKPGVILPMPTDFEPASLQSYASYYRYILVRGAPAAYIAELSRYYHFAGQSGNWSLFESAAGAQPS